MPALPYVAPRLSATVVLLRDPGQGPPEALLLRRHGRSGFAANAWVFPGGTVDDADQRLVPGRWRGIDPEALEPRFGKPAAAVLGLHVAAVRETFEEAGVLLGAHADGSPVDLRSDEVGRLRRAMAAGAAADRDFVGWLGERDIVLHLDALAYWSRWMTPRIEPRRYDTCFFLARAPVGQDPLSDDVETTAQRWMTAADALAAARSGELHLIYPTLKNLEALAAQPSADALLAAAHARPEVPLVLPHFTRAGDGSTRVLHPDDPDYPRALYPEELGS